MTTKINIFMLNQKCFLYMAMFAPHNLVVMFQNRFGSQNLTLKWNVQGGQIEQVSLSWESSRVNILPISFFQVPCEFDIHFVANMNNKILKIRLRGYGLEPKLLIRDVTFGYSVPYSMPLKRHLTVYNPTLFPIEVYIHGKDKYVCFYF